MKTHEIRRMTLNDGTTIPQLGFGTLNVQPDRRSTPANIERTAEVVGLALELGYRHIDTAQSYGNEQGVGKAIAAARIPRGELYVTSKLSNGNHRPDDVRRSFDETLEKLGLERLDLFLVHWPVPTLYDGDYVSTWKAMTELVAGGRLRTAGVSNFQSEHLDRIIAETGVVPAVNQIEVHPYFTNDAVRAASIRHGVAVEAHSPLGHGAGPAARRPGNQAGRRRARQDERTDRSSLAPPARPHRLPEVNSSRADGGKPSGVRLRALIRRGDCDRQPRQG